MSSNTFTAKSLLSQTRHMTSREQSRQQAQQEEALRLDVEQVQAALRNPEAFRHLVERYMDRVYGTTLRVLGQPADAHDAAQETFLRAWRALERFQIGRPFGPWVATIAINVARDHLRCPHRQTRRFGLQVDDETNAALDDKHAPADKTVLNKDRQTVLAAAIAKLKPRLQEAVVLRFVLGLSVEDVARALNIGQSATKMRLKRGLEQMRTELGEGFEYL